MSIRMNPPSKFQMHLAGDGGGRMMAHQDCMFSMLLKLARALVKLQSPKTLKAPLG
jgi:hypothetical protein